MAIREQSDVIRADRTETVFFASEAKRGRGWC
jgi:hypothetical protein